MMPGVNHQKAQEVREPQAAENGMVEMCPPLIRGGCEIRFEITHGRFQASQKVARRRRRPAWLDEVRGHGGFAEVPAFEHQPKKDPAREQLHDSGLNWPGEGAEKHPSTLLVGERHVFRHLPRRPLARRTRQGPLLGRNPACRCDEGADCLAIGGDHILKIGHALLWGSRLHDTVGGQSNAVT